jgi:hypothetical protein
VKRLALGLFVLGLAGCGGHDTDLHPTAVQEVKLGPDRTTLRLFIGTCDRYSLRADESHVEVRLDAAGEDEDGADCGGVDIEVLLDARLGERPIIDGSTGEVVPVLHCEVDDLRPQCAAVIT